MQALKNKFNQKLSNVQITLYSVLIFTFLFCFLVGLAALVLSSILFQETTGNSTICNNCPGVVNVIYTNNGTLSPLVNQSLSFNGTSGIDVSIVLPNVITITNLRDLTSYTVDCNGGSEFLTPQDAYNQAIIDGKGGGIGLNAVIIIAPCVYDFGTTQFLINTSNIIWSTLAPVSTIADTIVFSSSGPLGGIQVTLPLNSAQYMIFQGITFGLPGDNVNGFVLNVTQGQCTLSYCSCDSSNFRISVGGDGFTIFTTSESTFRPLPPNDFITTVDSNTVIIFESTDIIEVSSGTPGGHIFNYGNGIGESRMFDLFIVFDEYNGVYQGPFTGTSGEGTIQIEKATILVNDLAFPYFFKQEGSYNLEIFGSSFSLQGPLIYQNQDCLSTETHNLVFAKNIINSKNATILIESNVTIIGNNQYSLTHSSLTVTMDTLIINMPADSPTDLVNVTLANTLIETTGAALSVYAIGPDVVTATISVGSSNSLNGANAVSGFSYVALTAL